MIRTKFTGQETLLCRVDIPDNRIHDGARDTGSQEPVVSVSHTEGAGVRDEAGQFLRKKKKEAVVVTVRGLVTFQNGAENTQKDGGSKFRGGTPGSKGNAVRPRGGVVDGVENRLEVRFDTLVRVDTTSLALEKSSTLT